MRQPEPIREVEAVGPDGAVRRGTIMQYFHFVRADHRGNPDRWVESKCLRLRMAGLPDGEQSPRNPDSFYVVGVGEFLIQH